MLLPPNSQLQKNNISQKITTFVITPLSNCFFENLWKALRVHFKLWSSKVDQSTCMFILSY